MSAHTIADAPLAAPVARPSTSAVAVATARAAGVALVANVLVHTLARVAGVETVLTPPGAAPVTVALAAVVTMTLGPVVLGGVVLALASRVAPAAARALPWLGLFVGLGSVVMPLSMGGALDARLVLAAMHVVAGVAWFVSTRRVAA